MINSEKLLKMYFQSNLHTLQKKCSVISPTDIFNICEKSKSFLFDAFYSQQFAVLFEFVQFLTRYHGFFLKSPI